MDRNSTGEACKLKPSKLLVPALTNSISFSQATASGSELLSQIPIGRCERPMIAVEF